MENSVKREQWIDITKGIAMILVVMGHVISSYHEAGLYTDSQLYGFANQVIYSFHMALFMLVSGLLCSMGKEKKPKSRKITRTLLSYGVPYVVFTFAWVAAKTVLASVANNSVSLVDLLLIPIYPISFMWFIYALMLMQIVHALLGDVIISLKGKGLNLLCAAGGWLLQPILAERLTVIRFSDCILSDFLRFYLFFLLGAYCGRWLIDRINGMNRHTVLLVSFALLMGGNAASYVGAIPDVTLYRFLIAVTGSIFVVALSQHIAKADWLSYIGEKSLAIYVLQGIAIAGTRMIVTKIGLNDEMGLLPIMLCTVGGCLFPLIAYWISTKIWKLEAVFYPGKYIHIGIDAVKV